MQLYLPQLSFRQTFYQPRQDYHRKGNRSHKRSWGSSFTQPPYPPPSSGRQPVWFVCWEQQISCKHPSTITSVREQTGPLLQYLGNNNHAHMGPRHFGIHHTIFYPFNPPTSLPFPFQGLLSWVIPSAGSNSVCPGSHRGGPSSACQMRILLLILPNPQIQRRKETYPWPPRSQQIHQLYKIGHGHSGPSHSELWWLVCCLPSPRHLFSCVNLSRPQEVLEIPSWRSTLPIYGSPLLACTRLHSSLPMHDGDSCPSPEEWSSCIPILGWLISKRQIQDASPQSCPVHTGSFWSVGANLEQREINTEPYPENRVLWGPTRFHKFEGLSSVQMIPDNSATLYGHPVASYHNTLCLPETVRPYGHVYLHSAACECASLLSLVIIEANLSFRLPLIRYPCASTSGNSEFPAVVNSSGQCVLRDSFVHSTPMRTLVTVCHPYHAYESVGRWCLLYRLGSASGLLTVKWL